MSQMRALVLVLVLTMGSAGALKANSDQILWLPIVATSRSVDEALATARALGGAVPVDLVLVSTMDCKNLRKGLIVVTAGIFEALGPAENAVNEWRRRNVDDAYLRRCEVVTPSRLSMRLPLLDASLTNKPIEAISWNLEDAISSVVKLRDGIVALIIPRYEAAPEDVREGLRIGIKLSLRDERRMLELSPDCIDPQFVLDSAQIALVCVVETAADHLLHGLTLFSLWDGRVIAEAKRCTGPKFERDRWMCQRETVDANGHLELTPTVLPVH